MAPFRGAFRLSLSPFSQNNYNLAAAAASHVLRPIRLAQELDWLIVLLRPFISISVTPFQLPCLQHCLGSSAITPTPFHLLPQFRLAPPPPPLHSQTHTHTHIVPTTSTSFAVYVRRTACLELPLLGNYKDAASRRQAGRNT